MMIGERDLVFGKDIIKLVVGGDMRDPYGASLYTFPDKIYTMIN